MMQKIPIFFSVDEQYVPFLAVALNSIRENASPRYLYHIHILINSLTRSSRDRLLAFQRTNFAIEFNSLTKTLSSLRNYCPLFIPSLFPQYDKGIYLDADVIVPGDISWLWEEPLGNKYLGAVEDFNNSVSTGVLLLNLKAMRENDITGKFLRGLNVYSHGKTIPVQDCLNALCGNHLQYLDPCWNCMPSETVFDFDNPLIIHYNLTGKPWLNETVPYDELYWCYAKDSGYYEEIRAQRTAFLLGPHSSRIPISE